jgi:peptidoglycan hydrolase-like protein with peptidoglycan-binding domain
MKTGTWVVLGLGAAALLMLSSSSKADEKVIELDDGQTPPPAKSGGDLPPRPETYGLMTTLQVQQFLTALAKFENNPQFDPKGIDGAWGWNTETAVEAYQASRKLAIDGKVGPQTVAAMKADAAHYVNQAPQQPAQAPAESPAISGGGTIDPRLVMT